LREPWPRHPVAQTGQSDDQLLVFHTGDHPAFAGFTARRSLAPFARRSDGKTIALDALGAPGMKPLLAVAGIALPESFFSMLRACQVPLVKTLALPDHYDFDSFLRNNYEGYSIICTEKDAAKLWSTAPDAWAVPLVFEPHPAFFDAVTARVTTHLSTKLSLTHGHKTT
jgi:tetraacyldisaccharide 4'-kinase